MKTIERKTLATLLILVMVFSLSSLALAAPETTGTVTVSITHGNFAPDGKYTGGGFTNSNFYIDSYELSIDYVEEWVEAGLQELVYLPSDMSYLNLSVLDAIAVAFYENGFYDVHGDWDYYPVTGDPGGYIYDVLPQPIINYPPTIVTINGVDYNISSGTLWKIACTQWDNDLQDWVVKEISTYGSNIELVDGMEIIFDVSRYVIGGPPEGIYFAEESYTGYTGEHTTTVSAQAIDKYGEVIENAEITYSLFEPYTGISIDSSTGVVTVTPDAQAGSVQIRATYEGLSGMTTLYIRNSIHTNLTLSAKTNKTYNIGLTASNIEGFAGITFTLIYNPAVLQLNDLCAFTYEKELDVGSINQVGLTITSVSSGAIIFEVDQDIPQGKNWSGTINSFEFTALSDQSTTISVSWQ